MGKMIKLYTIRQRDEIGRKMLQDGLPAQWADFVFLAPQGLT